MVAVSGGCKWRCGGGGVIVMVVWWWWRIEVVVGS